MIFVDSSVWIDYFNGTDTPQTNRLDAALGTEPVSLGDIVLAEVLQGFHDERDFRRARHALEELTVYEVLGVERAIEAAKRFRRLRQIGVTVRKTTDVLIGSYCIDAKLPLLYSDRDFDPMVEHLGLVSALRSA